MPWSPVQSTGSQNQNTASLATAFSSNVTSGNVVIVAITADNAVALTFGVSDTLGTTYTAVASPVVNGTRQVQIFYGALTSSGANTVTVSTGATSGPLSAGIAEYSGLYTGSPLDASSSATGTSNSPTTGSIPVSGNGELVLGVLAAGQPGMNFSITDAGGFTNRYSGVTSGNSTIDVEDTSASSATAATWTITNSPSWAAMGASFTALIAVPIDGMKRVWIRDQEPDRPQGFIGPLPPPLIPAAGGAPAPFVLRWDEDRPANVVQARVPIVPPSALRPFTPVVVRWDEERPGLVCLLPLLAPPVPGPAPRPRILASDDDRLPVLWIGRPLPVINPPRIAGGAPPPFVRAFVEPAASDLAAVVLRAAPLPLAAAGRPGTLILFKRGPLGTIPTLRQGEPGWMTDTNQLFVGDGFADHYIGGLAGVPATNTAAGYPGMLATDGTYLYLCIAANQWKRVALSVF